MPERSTLAAISILRGVEIMPLTLRFPTAAFH